MGASTTRSSHSTTNHHRRVTTVQLSLLDSINKEDEDEEEDEKEDVRNVFKQNNRTLIKYTHIHICTRR